jgi:hypothetical protein
LIVNVDVDIVLNIVVVVFVIVIVAAVFFVVVLTKETWLSIGKGN